MKMRRRVDCLVVGRENIAEGFAKVAGVGRELLDRGIAHAFIKGGMLTGLESFGGGVVIPDVFHGGGISEKYTRTDGVVHSMLPFSRKADNTWGTEGAYI